MKTPKDQQTPCGAPPADAPLSPQRAFVVQFRERNGGPAISYTGRAEHMTSGQVKHFRSRAELWEFFERILTDCIGKDGQLP